VGRGAGATGRSGGGFGLSYPAMQNPQRPARRTRSAFAAAFLSFLFPGLGQAYSGAISRGLAFAALPFLAVALLGGIVLRADRLAILGFVIQQPVLIGLLIVNAVVLVYRLVAVVDAWQVARYVNSYEASGDRHHGTSRLPLSPLSVAGLLATVLVLAGGHVALARYNVLALDLVGCVFSDSSASNCEFPEDSTSPDASSGGSGSVAPGDSAAPSDAVTQPVGSGGTGTPAPALPPWNGTDRLNILLVGVDQRPADDTFNTDTMIVVSIDPVSKQVALFQLPRDSAGVPVPANAQGTFGATYNLKINQWWKQNANRGELWPGATSTTRGANALKAILGNLYGIQIPYYVMVNFAGFQRAVDALGGVTINVQIPVVDDDYPGIRVYIPAGPQVMDGYDALIYARSRHGSAAGDFDRGRRQQRVLLSIHDEVNPMAILANLPALVDTLQRSVKTDIPPSMIGSLLSLSSSVDTRNLHSFVFDSKNSYFATDMYQVSGGTNSDLVVHVDRIRQAVSTAFTIDPKLQAQQEALAAEQAQVYVLNGSGRNDLATNAAEYLAYAGLDASAPIRTVKTIATTTIVVYNGAEDKLPKTIAYLESLFGVQVATATDPTVPVDIVITEGKNAPELTIRAPG
jgi:LCP family protein required for cell wall assembly